MGLTELLQRIGDENISFQNLDSCMISANYSHNKGAAITFGSQETLTPDGTERLGVIVWLPRDKVKELLEENTQTDE